MENLQIIAFLETDVELPKWFDCPLISLKDCQGFKLKTEWLIENEAAMYAFKIPSTNPKGRFCGETAEYRFYLKYILISNLIENTFLALLDIDLELQPIAKKMVEISKAKGSAIEYLTHIQPAYNILCPLRIFEET